MMRRRQIKVVGNCQASAIANFYRDFVGAPNLENVFYVDDLGLDTQALRAAVSGADMVIVQERDFKHGLSQEELGGSVEVHTFPLVLAGFLWPFANEPHVHNIGERPISDGPYPSQMGDSYLNRLIRRGLTPEAALDDYLNLNIARVASLDRMMEIYLGRQRERDQATDCDVASAIEARFRGERMFLTAEHPDGNLFGVVAKQLFEKLGISAGIIETALKTLIRSPFPPTELPMHPGVISHFGLSYADPQGRYTFLDEGRFTFEEYVLRYMRYANNPSMRQAIYMIGREDPAETLRTLDVALEQSPTSYRGLRQKGVLLDRIARPDEATKAFEAAITIDPANPDAYVDFSLSLRARGRFAEAAATAQKAVDVAPTYGPPLLALAEALLFGGDPREAIAVGREALLLMPGHALVYRCLGIAYAQIGSPDEAEYYARRGMQIEPLEMDHRNILAEILESLGRRAEAIAVLEESDASGLFNDQSFSLLGNFHMRDGDLAAAESIFERGAALFGSWRTDLANCLAQVRAVRADRVEPSIH